MYRNKSKVSVILIIALFINGLIILNPKKVYAYEATEVSELISKSTTWSKKYSPYIVEGNVLVDEGATLKIQPGVEVIFDGNYYLDIKGKIIAQGSEKENIKFSSGTNIRWKGIKIESAYNKMKYCVVENSENGVHLKYETAHSNTIDKCKLINNDVGISLELCYSSESNKIQNCILAYNEIGVNIKGSEYTTISNCNITNNNIGIYQGVCLKKNYIRRNNIYNNDEYNLQVDTKNANDQYFFYYNYWGTTDKEEIEEMIFDFYDDYEYTKVRYEPYLKNQIGKLPDINIDVSEISFIEKYLILNLGESKKIEYSISPEKANENISWLTNNENVVKVKNGELTAVGEGRAIISVETENGDKKAECEVIVEDYIELPSEDRVLQDKIWTIEFNKSILFNEITSENIYILDKNGKKVDVTIEKNDDTSITITPVNKYNKGETYNLWVKDVRSIDKKELNKTMKMEFKIHGV
ncbi:NosD domain-containing protein [Oceanirhabdus seepicola]|uniref:Right-handed parallel beta-helix repeat-containing protein n=1 Tax=Oceanirhabdus seepicola TaxID=2828781 RepID=A0A9J6P325_9CLOT|nr:NosD domain-containing protein [Oceanirhabdus seepicola]MCM1990606.1 right-handed parallel beta-helix repeat-containing protein [Oceanirhabdus seepicola]